MRDAPYAGLFVAFYEGIKRSTCMYILNLLSKCQTHGELGDRSKQTLPTVRQYCLRQRCTRHLLLALAPSQPLLHIHLMSSRHVILGFIHNPFLILCLQTKVQVRREDRYQGLFRTVKTIWDVRLSLFLSHFDLDLFSDTGITASRDDGLLRRYRFAPFPQGAQLCDWVGCLRGSAHDFLQSQSTDIALSTINLDIYIIAVVG